MEILSLPPPFKYLTDAHSRFKHILSPPATAALHYNHDVAIICTTAPTSAVKPVTLSQEKKERNERPPCFPSHRRTTMTDPSRAIDVEKLISWSNDLVKVLQDQQDTGNLVLCLQQTDSLSSTCNSDLNDARNLLQDYQEKVDACKQKKEEARCETVVDAELDMLERELEEELEKERLLKEEFRAMRIEFNDLEQQRISVQEQKKNLLKIERAKMRTQMLLSMYVSVTNFVPNLDDQSKISGYMVEKHNYAVEEFDYDASKKTPFGVCNDMWKAINEYTC